MQIPKKARILFVDDEENIIIAVRYILENEGYSVESALDGEEALRKVEAYDPDIVLLDIMMPKIDGYEVCKIIKGNEKHQFLPIIILTALKQKEERIKGIESGADDFISKPIEQRELLTRIRSLLKIKFLNDKLKDNFNKLKDLEEYKVNLTDLLVHDLKNILSGSVGNLSLLMKELDQFSDKHKELISDAHANSKDILRMVLNLLDISKMEEDKMDLNCTEIDLKQITEMSVRTQESLAKMTGVKVVLQLNIPEGIKVSADKELIERVIINLLNNAIKYSCSGQEIIIKTKLDSKNNCAEVCVENRGSPIPKEFYDKIFEKFCQVEVNTAKQRLSSGLGLTFCKLAVEAHQGKIWLESDENGNNKFYFTLPINDKLA